MGPSQLMDRKMETFFKPSQIHIMPPPHRPLDDSDDEEWSQFDGGIDTTAGNFKDAAPVRGDAGGAPSSSSSPPPSTTPSSPPDASSSVKFFACGWRSMVLLAISFGLLVALGLNLSSTMTRLGLGVETKDISFDNPNQQYYVGLLTPSASSTPPPPSDSRTRTGTRTGTGTGTPTPSGTPTGSGTGTSSGTPSSTATPSPTSSPGTSATNTPTASITPSASNTPSPTPTSTGTPTATGTQSVGRPSNTECLQRAAAWANHTFRAGCNYDVACYGFTIEMAHHALHAVCPKEVADAIRLAYDTSLVPEDMCYLVLTSSGDPVSHRGGWASTVTNVWYLTAPSKKESMPWTTPVPGAEGMDMASQGIALAVRTFLVDHAPEAARCKWFFLAGENTFVNPRAALNVVRGLPHDYLRLQLGFIWSFMGFVQAVTGSAGGVSIWSSAAMGALADVFNHGTPEQVSQCMDAGSSVVRVNPFTENDLGHPVNNLVAFHACAMRSWITAVNLNQMDQSGALALNGVPLEPGPNGELMAWLQAPHNRGGHWVSVDNINADFQNNFFASYLATYGPGGVRYGVPGGEYGGVPGPSPPPTSPNPWVKDYAPPPPNAHPCAVRALAAMRGILEKGRDGPTSGVPLPLDVATEATSKACDPAGAAGGDAGGDPTPPHYGPHDVCYFVSRYTEASTVHGVFITQDGWAWRVIDNTWFFGAGLEPSIRQIYTLGGGPYDERHRMVPIIRDMWARSEETAHCQWWAFLSDFDTVTPRAIAGMVRGLRADVPQQLSFYWHNGPTGALTSAARGRAVLSRAAVAQLAERLTTPVCPKGAGNDYGGFQGTDDSTDVAVCTWGAGIIPIHTYSLDIAGMGILDDWAFQQEHYLLNWGLIVDQGYNPFAGGNPDGFPFRQALVTRYYNKLYGQMWNVSREDWYPYPGPYPGMAQFNNGGRRGLLRGGRAGPPRPGEGRATTSSSSSGKQQGGAPVSAVRELASMAAAAGVAVEDMDREALSPHFRALLEEEEVGDWREVARRRAMRTSTPPKLRYL